MNHLSDGLAPPAFRWRDIRPSTKTRFRENDPKHIRRSLLPTSDRVSASRRHSVHGPGFGEEIVLSLGSRIDFIFWIRNQLQDEQNAWLLPTTNQTTSIGQTWLVENWRDWSSSDYYSLPETARDPQQPETIILSSGRTLKLPHEEDDVKLRRTILPTETQRSNFDSVSKQILADTATPPRPDRRIDYRSVRLSSLLKKGSFLLGFVSILSMAFWFLANVFILDPFVSLLCLAAVPFIYLMGERIESGPH